MDQEATTQRLCEYLQGSSDTQERWIGEIQEAELSLVTKRGGEGARRDGVPKTGVFAGGFTCTSAKKSGIKTHIKKPTALKKSHPLFMFKRSQIKKKYFAPGMI